MLMKGETTFIRTESLGATEATRRTAPERAAGRRAAGIRLDDAVATGPVTGNM
jgi:hypothetical protein